MKHPTVKEHDPILTRNCATPASLLVYLLGGIIFGGSFVLYFIITVLLLAADFYYLKNIAGRRLVGLRWWNEVNPQTGDSHWVFESAPQPNEPGGKLVNATDKRFFWLALYAQPALWVALAIVALVQLKFIWLTLVGEFLHKKCRIGLDVGMRRRLTTVRSHRARLDDHEYPRLLPMRQVQPGQRAHGKRVLLGIAGKKCWRRAGFANVQSMIRCRKACLPVSILDVQLSIENPSLYVRSSGPIWYAM